MAQGLGQDTVGLVLAALLVAPGVRAEAPAGADRQLRVSASVANLRATPSTKGAVIGQVRMGDTVKWIATSAQWHQVETAKGLRGYLFAPLATFVSVETAKAAPPAAAAKTTPAPVNITHASAGCLVAEQHPRLDACFDPSARVGRAEIHFRASDQDPWYAVGFGADGVCREAVLPRPLRSTREVQYYVSVVDQDFQEALRPDSAPVTIFRARVVGKPSQCQQGIKLAPFGAGLAAPLVVRAARDAAGKILSQVERQLLESQLTLAGFSPKGVVIATTGLPPGKLAKAQTSSSSGQAAAGAATGLSKMTILLGAAGAAVGVGVVAAVSGGGGDSSNAGNAGSSIAGRWTCTWKVDETYNGATCTSYAFRDVLDLQQSGSSVSGSLASTVSPSVAACGGLIPLPLPIPSGTCQGARVSGTVSGSQIQMRYSPGGTCCCVTQSEMLGSIAGSSMTGRFGVSPFSAPLPAGFVMRESSWSCTR